jgi:phosphopantetheine--protein transferase-like protein
MRSTSGVPHWTSRQSACSACGIFSLRRNKREPNGFTSRKTGAVISSLGGCSGPSWVVTWTERPVDSNFAIPPTENLSLDLGLYAITRGRELGVDLEHFRPALEHERIAERFFSPREVATLRTLPVESRQEAFFACWTRKEAYLKAKGEGLMRGLEQFTVSLVPGEPAALLSTEGDPQEAVRWSLRELSPRSEYVAALAVEGHD